MGSLIEVNDTLKISTDRGFPAGLRIEDHVSGRDSAALFVGQEFSFWNEGERLYHRAPTRVFLVEEINGKWLYWGHALITEQTIMSGKTKGVFRITKIYDPKYQFQATQNEAPEGKSYF